MYLYSLSKNNETIFAFTDEETFLNTCVTLYESVSDETYPTYEDKSELPTIFESFGYEYQKRDLDNLTSTHNNDLINLFNKLAQYNPSSTYDNATDLLYGCNMLLLFHTDACKQYIGDLENELSLLQLIAGEDGLEQLYWHKDFRSAYNVSVY